MSLLKWSRERQGVLRCGERKEPQTGAVNSSVLKMLLSLLESKMSRFSFVSLKLFLCFVCRDSGGKHTTLSPTPLSLSLTRFLFLLLFLSLFDSEMTANDRRNRRGSSLGRSCSLERFQGSEPPKPTNRGDGRRLSSRNQYDIAKCPLIEPHGVQKKGHYALLLCRRRRRAAPHLSNGRNAPPDVIVAGTLTFIRV